MPTLKISPFLGMAPRTSERLIADGMSESAENVNLTSGEIRPLRSPKMYAAMNTLTSVYRAESGGNEKWFGWSDLDVDVARAPLASDVEQRYYWTGDGEPRYSTFGNLTESSNIINLGSSTLWALGVPNPTTAVSVSHSGGTGSATTRFYRYTFVTALGEESGPSPVSAEVTGKIDGTWNIGGTTAMQAVPANSGSGMTTAFAAGKTTYSHATNLHWLRVGDQVVINSTNYSVTDVPTTKSFKVSGDTSAHTSWARVANWNTSGMYRRLYRTTGSTGAWQMVSEYVSTDPLYAGWTSATTFSDTYLDSAIAGDDLISETWEPAPAALKGLGFLPSGAAYGFVNNLLCFSEPYQPHAWPTSYQLATDYPIVGASSYGTVVVAATGANPYLADGVEPASATLQRIDNVWPCLSKRGVVSFGGGVFFPTKIGLAFVSAAGPQLATAQLYSQYEWDSVNSETFSAATYNGLYYTTRTAGDTTDILVIAPSGWVTTYNITTDVLYTDPSQGRLYYVSGTDVLELEPTEGVTLPYSWKSKTFVTAVPMNIGACRIDATFSMTPAEQAAIDAANLALAPAILADTTGLFNASVFNAVTVNGQTVNPTPTPSESLQFTLYADGDVFFTKTVVDNKVFRLPAGKKYDTYAFRIAGNVPVQSIVLGETADSLRTA